MLNNQSSSKALVYFFMVSLFAILLLIDSIVLIRCGIQYNYYTNPISIFINCQNTIWTCYTSVINLFSCNISYCLFIPAVIFMFSTCLNLNKFYSQLFPSQLINDPNVDLKSTIWIIVKGLFFTCYSLIRRLILLHSVYGNELLLK